MEKNIEQTRKIIERQIADLQEAVHCLLQGDADSCDLAATYIDMVQHELQDTHKGFCDYLNNKG